MPEIFFGFPTELVSFTVQKSHPIIHSTTGFLSHTLYHLFITLTNPRTKIMMVCSRCSTIIAAVVAVGAVSSYVLAVPLPPTGDVPGGATTTTGTGAMGVTRSVPNAPSAQTASMSFATNDSASEIHLPADSTLASATPPTAPTPSGSTQKVGVRDLNVIVEGADDKHRHHRHYDHECSSAGHYHRHYCYDEDDLEIDIKEVPRHRYHGQHYGKEVFEHNYHGHHAKHEHEHKHGVEFIIPLHVSEHKEHKPFKMDEEELTLVQIDMQGSPGVKRPPLPPAPKVDSDYSTTFAAELRRRSIMRAPTYDPPNTVSDPRSPTRNPQYNTSDTSGVAPTEQPKPKPKPKPKQFSQLKSPYQDGKHPSELRRRSTLNSSGGYAVDLD
ncbi:hypothetical protein J3R30DRAFT_1243576 [Lentinula aciculospora]|uniref:Uncharacterized protein n=1 Tax=Lentinula aciculospora TaxID=153920 RepID=A0A9W9DI38_9AGAR|nr:hypothetical protein J3R30DRAFT_1243576 [Lentinula aciculospora]